MTSSSSKQGKFAALLSRRREIIFLLIIFIVALVIRLIGLDWGLPNQDYPYSLFEADEPNILYATLLLGNKVFQVTIIRSQPFFYYLSFPIFGLYYLVGLLTGHIASLADFQAQYLADNGQFLLVGRTYIAIVASLTVGLTYFVGKRMFGAAVGIVSSIFLLFSFGHIVYAKIYRPATLLPFIYLLAFYLILGLLRTRPGKLLPFALAGLVMAFAVATKVAAWSLIAPLILVPFVSGSEETKRLSLRPHFDRRYPYAWFVFLAIAFALLIPSIMFRTGGESPISIAPYVGDVTSRLDHTGTTGYLPTLSPYEFSLPWHLQYILPNQVGWPIYLLAIFGFGLMIFDKRHRPEIILFLVTVAAYILPIGYLTRTTWRDMLPMLPFFALGAGYFVVVLYGYIVEKSPLFRQKKARNALIIIGLILILAWPIYNITRQQRLLVRPDTREIARDWIEENIPAGSRLAMEVYGPGILDESIEQINQANVAALGYSYEIAPDRPLYNTNLLEFDLSTGKDNLHPEWVLPYLLDNDVEYVVLSSGYYGRYYNDAVDVLFSRQGENGRAFHDVINSNLDLVTEFVPDRNSTPGPVIKIYKVPEQLSVEGTFVEGSFEPFPGMDRPATVVGYYQFSPR